MEFRVHEVRSAPCCVVGSNAVSSAKVATVEQTAADDTLLDPPFSRIDERGVVLRHLIKKLSRFGIFLPLAQMFDANEEVGRLAAPGGINGVYEGGCVAAVANDCSPGAEQGLRPAERAEPFGLVHASAVEKHLHPPPVVLRRQQM